MGKVGRLNATGRHGERAGVKVYFKNSMTPEFERKRKEIKIQVQSHAEKEIWADSHDGAKGT